MNANGWLVSSAFAKWMIGVIIALLVSVGTIGISIGTLRADVNAKAEKIDVAEQQATQTQVLLSINEKLGDLKESVEAIDKRQRKISADVAKLEAKAE